MNKKNLLSLFLFLLFIITHITNVSAEPQKKLSIFNKNSIKLSSISSTKTISLDFIPTDSLIHPSKPIIFLTDSSRKRIYSIDYELNKTSYVSLNLTPERLAIQNNELYITLMTQPHDNYIFDDNQSGAISIRNLDDIQNELLRVKIKIDPYDIVTDNNNFMYIPSGSGQWTQIKSFSRLSIPDPVLGYIKEVSSASIRMKSFAQINPSLNKIYTITTDSSPRDISSYSIDNSGIITGGYDSPYHGDHPMEINFKISPDGKYIFNGAGTVFSCSNELSKDLNYVATLDSKFNDINFDMNSNSFFTAATENKIYAYSYDTFSKNGYFDTIAQSKFLFTKDDSIISISVDSSGKSLIEVINKSSMQGLINSTDDGIKLYGRVTEVVYDSLQNKAYAIDTGLNNLLILDLNNNSIEKTIKLPYKPSGLCISEENAKLYIANEDTNYLITEITLSNYSIRNAAFSAEKSYNDFAHKRILNKNGKLFITNGEWRPKLLTFDADSLKLLSSYPILDSVGNIAVSNDGKYLFTLYQTGWSSYDAYSYLTKYEIKDGTYLKVSEGGTKNSGYGHLNSPIFLFEDENAILAGTYLFNGDDLSYNEYAFTDSILAMSKSTNMLATTKGFFRYIGDEVRYYKFIPEKLYDVKFFTNKNLLYVLDNNTLYHFIPIPGDANSDEIVNIQDLALTAKCYNAKKGNSSYDFTKDFNYDNIIDLYDLVIVSREL